jgi:TPR repeat protein
LTRRDDGATEDDDGAVVTATELTEQALSAIEENRWAAARSMAEAALGADPHCIPALLILSALRNASIGATAATTTAVTATTVEEALEAARSDLSLTGESARARGRRFCDPRGAVGVVTSSRVRARGALLFVCGLWASLIEQNFAEGARLYQQAAQQGLAVAQYFAAWYLEHGLGVARNCTEAARWYRTAAAQGIAEAQYNAGLCLATGQGGVELSPGEAAEWFRRAAAQGHAGAQFELGRLLDADGKHGEAVALYSAAAGQGVVDAQVELARCLLDGGGGSIAKDVRESVRLLRMAASQGHVVAQHRLGKALLEEDPGASVALFRSAAERGLADAQFDLAACLSSGRGFAVPHLAEAAEWYSMAAAQGHATAQLSYAMILEAGRGVPQCFGEAAKWYRSAAEQKLPEAQYRLGCCLADGRGVPRDDTEAARMFQLAADAGHVEAQNRIGICLAIGQRDLAKAKEYFLKASEQRDAAAPFLLGLCLIRETGSMCNQALRFFRLSALRGYALAQFNVGQCYEAGTGGATQNVQEAAKWYRLAAMQGHAQAQASLAKLLLAQNPKDEETIRWLQMASR